MKTKVIAATFLLLAGCVKKEVPVEEVLPVRVRTVAQSHFDQQLVFPGYLSARYSIPLGFEVQGRILKRYVDVGAKVKQGELIAKLDPRYYHYDLSDLTSRLKGAQSSLDRAANDLARSKKLVQKGFVSPTEFDRYNDAFKVAKSNLDSIRAQLATARKALHDTELRSPYTGVITEVLAEPGQVVAVGTPVVRLARGDLNIEVTFDVPESEINALKPAQTLQIAVWSMPDQQFAAKIREMSPEASATNARTYRVRATLINEDPRLQLGMSAKVLVTKTQANIRIPASALFEKEGKPAVWTVSQDHTVSLNEVTLGDFVGNEVDILQGLPAGAIIVTAGVHVLRPGLKVEPILEKPF
jgi:RND family efflux transporter MFP subunit